MSTGNVLIVEDDQATRDLLSMVLVDAGFNAVAAEDGLEALHLLRTVKRRSPESPCLVLLDLTMPRFGGGAFRRAQLGDANVKAVPVVVMSGVPDLETRAIQLGAVATISKPIDCDELLTVVRRICCGEENARA